jgi:hypothetical protein
VDEGSLILLLGEFAKEAEKLSFEKDMEARRKAMEEVMDDRPAEPNSKRAPIGDCSMLPPVKVVDDSLAEAAKGKSLLHGLFEITLKAKPGVIRPESYESEYGENAARTLKQLGVTSIEHTYSGSKLHLDQQLEFGDHNGRVVVGEKSRSGNDFSFSFTPRTVGSKAVMADVEGVSVTRGLIPVSVYFINMEAQAGGHMSAVLRTKYANVRLCADQEGKIESRVDTTGSGS